MKISTKTFVLAAALSLMASPALALPPQVPDNDGTQHAPAGTPPSEHGTPGPKAGLPEKAQAYGRYCKGFSRKHVSGTRGTPFSRCVTAMAKVATGEETSPRAACATLSHKHKAGAQGTPFGRCVVAARRLAEQPAGA
jgi:hypothetical protein